MSSQKGAISVKTIVIILLSVSLVTSLSFGIWAYVQYYDYKTNFDTKRDIAVVEAKRQQAELDEQKFIEREKEPNRDFVGPEDYGRVTFKYPKTWSVYEAHDLAKRSNQSYEAYLYPVVVPPVSNDGRYAIRVVIQNSGVDEVLKQYEKNTKEGLLKTSTFVNGDYKGTRIDGQFSKKLRGSAVLFKIRDKTFSIRTDSDVFKKDFNKIIKTIKFNK